MTATLLIIDLQQEFTRRTLAGRPRSTPGAETRAAAVLAAFRAAGRPVLHIHHDDPDPASGFRLDKPTGAVMPEMAPLAGERVIVKRTSSAFAGTGVHELLQADGCRELVVVGAALDFCVNSTIRGACDLGYAVQLVTDATFNFGSTGPDGTKIAPETVRDVTLATLAQGFARLVQTADVI